MGRRFPFDILLAGIGAGGRRNTTLATVEQLSKARLTFSLSIHSSFVRQLCQQVVQLDGSFYTGEKDEDVYERIARRVLNEAARAPGVALVDDGHPLFFDDVGDKILRRASRLGLKVVSLPAVSCLDTMIAQCGLRIGCVGTQIVEATTLVLYDQKLNPSMDTLVMQIGWFGTSLLVEIEAHTKERFLPLQKHLLKFYPRDHPIRLLRAAELRNEKPLRVGLRLGQLANRFRSINTDCTLYIPGLDNDSRCDATMLRQLTDRDHLSRIARPRKPRKA